MLGQGCLRAFFAEQFLSLKVGLRWVYLLKWVQKRVKSGFWVQKWVSNASKPTFISTLKSFQEIDKTPLLTHV